MLGASSVQVALAALAIVGRARGAGQGNSIYFSGADPCPILCDEAGPNPNNWTAYHSVERVGYCSAPLVLSFAVFTPLDDPKTGKSIRTCALGAPNEGNNTVASKQQARKIHGKPHSFRLRSDNATNGDSSTQQQAPAQAAWKDSSQTSDGANVILQAQQLENFFESTTAITSSLGPSLLFSLWPNTLTSIGIYAGTGVPTRPLVDALVNFIQAHGYSGDGLVQACSSPGAAAAGIVASTGPQSLITAQRAVRDWANSTCVSAGYDTVLPLSAPLRVSAVSSAPLTSRSLWRRDVCRTVDVESGNLCADLARKCNIQVADLLKYNPQSNFCTTLKVPQKVCCTAGELPIPKPDAAGNCATYNVQSGDSCWGITSSLSGLISTADLEKYNKNTWGWGGCSNLQANMVICLSSGRPPLPLPVSNAECGPIKPGTTAPAADTDLASLNPCPLNACCNVWGRCGTTDDFCLPAPTNQAPGAPQPLGSPNCISNCGTGIVNNRVPPASFIKVGYFEGYGVSRPCDRVDIRTVNLDGLTHIHFAFATVTADKFEVNMGPTVNQFYYFKQLTGVKKILSFGGWTFSTDPTTYGIFRTGVLGKNRNTMATNIANFIIDNNLDGVDIDWEYPAAPDIPGIPEGDPSEGLNYLRFLTALRNLLPPSKSVSFAAPAGYWYLKGFPMERIAEVVDYVIYMTYDLHGQWDYNNKWADPGCVAGNCLRSHINMTETVNSLSMITKAGVPSNKIVIGVSSYGRSFKMTTAGCTGPMCTYTGPESGATPGKCTGTAGYISNAEIKDIIKNNPTAKTWSDGESMSNILVYDTTQWVAYMDDNNKRERAARYKALNFLGTSDWAISLDNEGLTAPAPITIGPNETFPVPQDAVNPQIHSSCERYKDIILEAWNEAGELTKAPPQWSRWNKYQGVLDTYLGPRSGQIPWFNDEIWSNFQRHYQAHYGGQYSQRGLYNYYYCDVDQMPQKVQDKIGGRKACKYFPAKRSGTAAKTWRFPGNVWSEYYTLLCPWWLGQEPGAPPFGNLKDIAYEGDSYETLRKQIDRWGKSVRAVTIYHETAHWQDISKPNCDANEYYAPEEIASFAKYGGNGGYDINLKNAHSWALSTTAMWMMQRWPDIGVPMPSKPISTTPPTTLVNPDVDGGEAEAWADALDEDWFDPAQVNPAEFTPLAHYGPLGQGGPLSGCFEGKYEFEAQCLMLCDLGDQGRACSKNDDGTWQCANCDKAPTSCTEGLYADWDTCRSNCLNGLCSQNAGENGKRCRC